MEAATVTREAPPEPAPEHDGEAEATRSTEELFQWSTYVHVGDGAEGCEHAQDGKCEHRGHFHAWLCLPNTFQARDITDKANAARARRRRSLLEEGSDSNIVLEDDLAAWTANDHTWQALVEVIANRNVEAQVREIADELRDTDEFEHHDADLEEYRRQMRLSDEERDAEDWKRLNADMESYRLEFQKRAEARFEREKQVLSQTKRDELLDLQRRWMVDTRAQEVWYHIYYTWAWYTCARKPVAEGWPTERVFDKPEDLKSASPQTVDALRAAYNELESRMLVRSDAAGN